MFGECQAFRDWRGVARQLESFRIEDLSQQRGLPLKQQVARRIERARIRVEEDARVPGIERSDTYRSWRAEEEKVTAIRQKGREPGRRQLSGRRVRRRHRDRCSSLCRHAVQRAVLVRLEDDCALTIPGTAAEGWRATR